MKILQSTAFICMVFTIIPDIICAQEVPIRESLPHGIQTYIDSTGALFVNQNQSYQVLLSGNINEEQKNLTFESSKINVAFSEGENKFLIRNEEGVNSETLIIVDGTSPLTSIDLQNAPTFETDGELYVGKGLHVELNVSDNYAGVQQSYWAINNYPFNPFLEENSRFDSEGDYILYYYSVDQVGNIEDVKFKSFQIDLTGPDVDYTIEGTQQLSVLSANSSISLNASDEGAGSNKIYFWFNDDKIQPYSTTISLSTLADGEHVFNAYAVDRVENIGDTLTYTFYLDKDEPLVTADIIGEKFDTSGTKYINAASTISLTSKDNKSGTSWLRYTINQEDEKSYVKPIQLPSVSGSYTITFYAGDIVGNFSDRKSLKVYVDHNPPVTNSRFSGYYSKTSAGYAVKKETLISFESSDLESGVKRIQYRQNSDEWVTYITPLSFNDPGVYNIDFRAIDMVGNMEEIQSLEVSVLTPSEMLTSQSAPEKPTQNNSHFIKNGVNIEGPHTEIYLWISASNADTSKKMLLTVNDSDTKFPLLLTSNKENNIEISVDGSTNTFPITIDGNAPNTTIKVSNTPSYKKEDKLIFASGVSLSLSAEDNITGIRNIFTSENGGRYQPYESPLRGYYSEQEYNIRYYAEDNVGNSETERIFSFNVDATPPITTHTFVDNFSGTNVSPYTKISFSADDNMSGVMSTFIKLNNNDPIPYSGILTLEELGVYTEPFNTITYYSIDNVGNTEQTKQLNFKIDQLGPIPSIHWNGKTYVKNNTTYIHPSTLFSLSAEDAEMEILENWYRINNDKKTRFDAPVSLSRFDQLELIYSATDVLGNKGEITQRMIIVDKLKPESKHIIQGNIIQSGNTLAIGVNSSIDISASDEDSGISSIFYKINNEKIKTYNNKSIRFSTSGTKLIRYYATDNVGNIESENIVQLIYDETPPEIDLKFSKQPISKSVDKVVISTSSFLTIQSIDNHSEVKSLSYSLNENDFSAYILPLTFDEIGTYVLVVKAEDLLGNIKSKKIIIEVQ